MAFLPDKRLDLPGKSILDADAMMLHEIELGNLLQDGRFADAVAVEELGHNGF
jgi:hypothetical protein